ncbi:hypothetical protein AB840_04130 [Megasphaera cerevisiae DSM 20462]|uniref:Phage protein n=1 Tax=Megasphaera cerevisiae DSM 20462 TaxID=1122219 RepID=A0A0J6WYA2_9FIRM|nr:hypothetical protein [Megasphaera cerevisiae]KMO87223.1 hypothetical protein AB840_04130 [Megasphaera cerevisiae DSM 20462]SJZ61048.1 hypothetical protein SAMN05660900_00958 [Megasphaera cerevisiae DSM 20462]
MTQDEAVQAIIEKVQIRKAQQVTDTASLTFFAEKLVVDILDYCHRDDFPPSLVYTVADLICKRIDDEVKAAAGAPGPLKRLQQNDTTYEWAVNATNAAGILSDADFDSIKPKLNRWRKVVWP